MSGWRRLREVTLGALAVWGTAACALWWVGEDQRTDGPADVIIVLGCRTLEDGTPSLCLRRRTERAVALWREGAAPGLLTTGGIDEGPVSEGVSAATFAASLGVPSDQILVESASTSTWENAAFSRPLTSADHVVLVTDAPHAWRARAVFARFYGQVDVVVVRRPWWTQAPMALREALAVGWYLARGRVGWTAGGA